MNFLYNYKKEDNSELSNDLREIMELKEWQNGFKLCLQNIIAIFQEANVLMTLNRWSRGCFLFITAYEELATAFYILGNYNTPNPKQLKELLYHPKKLAISSFLTFPATGDLRILQEYFNKYIKIKFEDFDLKKENFHKEEWYKFGNKLQQEESLSYWRKSFLYLSISHGKTKFFSPNSISKEVKARIAIGLCYKLSFIIPVLQLLMFKISKSDKIDIKEILFKNVDMELWKFLDNIYEFDKVVATHSIEKIRAFNKVSPKLKDLAITYVSDRNKIKDDQFRIDFLNEALKDIALKYSKIWEDEKKRADIKLFANFVGKLNKDLGERIEYFFIVLDKIAKGTLSTEDLHKYVKKPIFKKKI